MCSAGRWQSQQKAVFRRGWVAAGSFLEKFAMKIHPLDEKLYAETLARLTEMARPFGQKHVDYVKWKLDKQFAFRATLDASEIDGENLKLRWRSKLRRWVARILENFQIDSRIKKCNSFKLDA
jgi:hypothetical protein